MPERYMLVERDDFATIVVTLNPGEVIGRALTWKDGEALVEAMNSMAGGPDLRDRVLDAVNDAVEDIFEGQG